MDTAELMKKVRKIEIKMKGLNTQLFSGEYHSAFKGRGMSFSEIREYTYGDDVRNIEWNVTARANTPYIKIFEEERELTLMLLIDVSKSMGFASTERTKRDVMIEVAAVLGFSALTNNDKVGAILFSDKVEAYIPPQKGRKSVLKLIRELLVNDPKSIKTDIALACNYLNNVQKKRCIAFLISDFHDQNYDNAMSLTARRHDFIGVQILDPLEKRIDSEMGMLPCTDPETGAEFFMDLSDKSFVSKYNDICNVKAAQLQAFFKKQGAKLVSLNTNDDYVKALISLFKKNQK